MYVWKAGLMKSRYIPYKNAEAVLAAAITDEIIKVY